VLRLLCGEPQRVPEHFREVVPHQQRFVLVDGQARELLARTEAEAHAPLLDTVLADELVELIVQAEPRVFQVHCVDRMCGRHRHEERGLRDFDLAVVAYERGHAPPRLSGIHAVEVDERHRARPRRHVGHARAKPAADECEMRIGVGRLDRPLLGRQLRPAIEIVVEIARAFRKNGREEIDVRPYGLRSRAEARGEALRQISSRRVQRAIQAAVVPLEHVAIGGRGLRSNIDDVEPASGRDVETEFEWWHRDI
jgi:hypothetical protein